MDGDYVMVPGKKDGHLVLVDLRSSMYYRKNGLQYFSIEDVNLINYYMSTTFLSDY